MDQFCTRFSQSGVSVDAIVLYGRQTFRENILFTHRGLSGPAILQISSYWRDGDPIAINLAPSVQVDSFLKDRRRTRPKAELKTILAEILPARLAEVLAKSVAIGQSTANLPDRGILAIADRVGHFEVRPIESEGWSKAEVTVGGIDTDLLSSKTMESRSVLGLYAIGEAVDVTGWLGGYNFQWAWSSGWCAGNAI